MTDAIGEPIYQHIANALRLQIASGKLPVGGKLPSTRELMEIYGASNNVVRNAVEVLKREGLAQGRPGKAVFVRATPQEVKKEQATLETVGKEVADLREQVRELGENQPDHVVVQVEKLRTEVSRLQEDLRLLYNRLGHPYPRGGDPEPKRRRSGA